MTINVGRHYARQGQCAAFRSGDYGMTAAPRVNAQRTTDNEQRTHEIRTREIVAYTSVRFSSCAAGKLGKQSQRQEQRHWGRLLQTGSHHSVQLKICAPNFQGAAGKTTREKRTWGDRIRVQRGAGCIPGQWVNGSWLSSHRREAWKVSGFTTSPQRGTMWNPGASISGAENMPGAFGPKSQTLGRGEGSRFRPFVDYAVEELSRRSDFSPLPPEEEFRNMSAKNVFMDVDSRAFVSSKIRMFRIACIEAETSIQFLNVAGFPRPEYDLPIFCADFALVQNRSVIVLDLNPLFNTDGNKGYKDQYFSQLMPLVNKYAEVLPWGGKLTSESLQFFSPLLIWTRPQGERLPSALYAAFQDYLGAWLSMVESASPSSNTAEIAENQEAQHRYLSWRVTKDPGRPMLARLCGEELAERYIQEFLFNGIKTLGTKSFLDYFPEYLGPDGGISKQRSVIGKAFEKRPWDTDGNLSCA